MPAGSGSWQRVWTCMSFMEATESLESVSALLASKVSPTRNIIEYVRFSSSTRMRTGDVIS